MNLKIIISMSLLFLNLFSCGQKKEDKAFKIFNEGVALNLKSIEEHDKGNYEKAALLNKESIDKFRETLKIDSAHSGARGALGHSLYVDKQFKEAIYWFEESNRINGEAVHNLRELGLCKVNLGQPKAGKVDIDKAFSIDKSQEIRNITLADLTDIGELAFEYGNGYIKEGDIQKGKDYKYFAIGVLMLVYDYDNSMKEIALKISDFATDIGDKETATKYQQFAKK